MQNTRWLVVLASCLACSNLAGTNEGNSGGTGVTYKADFSVQFVESSVHQGGVRLLCSDTYNLIGTITVVIRNSSSSAVSGDGRVNANQQWLRTTGDGCTRGPDRSTSGDWTADLSGTPAQLAFTVQREGGTSFVVKTTYAFSGARATSGVTGNIAFTQTGRGITGGTTNSTSDASASVSVTLR